MLAVGNTAPYFDAINSWVVGAGGPFGAVANSAAFATTDLFLNPITCQVGECIFSFTNSGGGGAPAEWYLDYLPANPGDAAPIAFGNYTIEMAAIPLPAAGQILLIGLIGLASARMRRKG